MTTLAAVADQLSLTGKTWDSYYGSWGGSPIAVSSLISASEFGLLFQIRHHVLAESLPDQDAFDWGDELGSLIDEQKAKVEVEERLAWFTLHEADAAIQCGAVSELVGAVLSGLAAGGIESLGDTCHYCLTNRVDVIRYEQGRVAQVCDGCLAGRLGVQAEQKQVSAGGFFATCLVGLLVSPAGAVAWAVCWIARLWVFELMWGDREYVMVPIYVAIGQVVVFGLLTGCTVGWAISKIPKRGYHSAGMIAAASAFGAVIIGEVLLGSWIAYYVMGEFSVANVLGGAVALWFAGGMEAVTRAATVLVSLGVAYGIARPKVDPLGL